MGGSRATTVSMKNCWRKTHFAFLQWRPVGHVSLKALNKTSVLKPLLQHDLHRKSRIQAAIGLGRRSQSKEEESNGSFIPR